VASTSGNQPLTSSSTKLSFQPSTSTLTASIFSGAATNIYGGATNQISVQSAANTTTFIIAPTTASTVLSWSGSAFTWVGIGGSTMVYPSAGIPNSTGSAWTTSYSTTGTGTVVALATSPVFVTPTLGVATATSYTENGYAVVSQADVGTAPNKIPLNQYLGTMAYQDAKAVQIAGGSTTNLVATSGYQIQPTVTTISAAGSTTLTVAQLLTYIVQVTQTAAVTLVLPTGTLTDAGVLNGLGVTNNSFLWIVINTGSVLGAITLSAGTGHTYVGSATVAVGTSAQFQTVKTATNTFVTYRIA
jgi:hypothetical protein